MKPWLGLVAALLLTAPVALAASSPPVAHAPEAYPQQEASMQAGCTAPCGFIVPFLDLNFPEKADCSSGNVLGVAPTLDDCLPAPEPGRPVRLEGTFRLYWDVSYDGTYPADPNAPIEVTFSPTSTAPAWIDYTLEPATFTLDAVTLLNPQEFQLKENPDGTPALWYWFERAVTLTFSDGGEPDEDDLERIENNGGVQPLFIKMRSTGSGAQIRESYGIEVFRFNGGGFYDDDASGSGGRAESNDSPVLALPVMAAALAAFAVVTRRRD